MYNPHLWILRRGVTLLRKQIYQLFLEEDDTFSSKFNRKQQKQKCVDSKSPSLEVTITRIRKKN